MSEWQARCTGIGLTATPLCDIRCAGSGSVSVSGTARSAAPHHHDAAAPHRVCVCTLPEPCAGLCHRRARKRASAAHRPDRGYGAAPGGSRHQHTACGSGRGLGSGLGCVLRSGASWCRADVQHKLRARQCGLHLHGGPKGSLKACGFRALARFCDARNTRTQLQPQPWRLRCHQQALTEGLCGGLCSQRCSAMDESATPVHLHTFHRLERQDGGWGGRGC